MIHGSLGSESLDLCGWQVSKIAQANFLVFDAAIANLAIGDPMARCDPPA